jgi:hypothetical protein
LIRWFAIVIIAFPFILAFSGTHVWVGGLQKRLGYEINEKGVSRASWTDPIKIGWKQVDNCRFSNHPQVPEVRVVEFRIKGPISKLKTELWIQFPFDPNEVDEREIQKVVETYFLDERKRQGSN